MADNENYIENIQFGEDEEIYPIRDAEAHEEIDEVKEDYVEKEGGELADTIVTYEDEETTVSSFTDFISNFVSGSKVAKWFKDFRAGVEYILHVGSLVNNCVTDNAELPLSAAQGKVLMDELTSVKSDLTELDTSLNSLKVYMAMPDDNKSNIVSMTIKNSGFLLCWYGTRGATTANTRSGMVLIDTTQESMNYRIITDDGQISNISYANYTLTFTFTASTYWQVNALWLPALG